MPRPILPSRRLPPLSPSDCADVVGAANAGKSSFINHCLRHVAPKATPAKARAEAPSVTTSHLPGTTLDFVRISVFSGARSLYDTPGVILPNQLTTRLTTDELAQVVPKKRAQHVTLRLGEGKSVLLGGVAQVGASPWACLMWNVHGHVHGHVHVHGIIYLVASPR